MRSMKLPPIKNWFALALACMHFGAGTYELWQGRTPLAVMWYAYAVSAVAIAFV